MGVRGVWTHFRSLFKRIEPTKINKPLKLGIDMLSLLYTYRSCIDEFISLVNSWYAKGHTITCVWDGVAPKEKKEIIVERRSIRDSALDKKSDLEKYLEEYGSELSDTDIKHIKAAIQSFSWQGWHLTANLKKEVQEKLANTTFVYAKGEADDLLLDMAFSKDIDVIVSLDSDMFVMGAPRIWRIINIRRDWIVEDISVEAVCDNWGISLTMLQDASFLAGWDRCYSQGKGGYMKFDTALTRVKHYGSWKNVLNKIEKGMPDEGVTEILNGLKKKSRERWQQYLNNI
jgi:5'-3' exonuclease